MAIPSPINTSPPLILALENSTMCGSVALVSGGNCLYEQSLLSSKTHSRRLLPAINELLAATAIDWPDLHGLAISLGPGSFTGLRIGLATIKGLAMATGLPLLGIASLDGLASQLNHCPLQICPILDARKSEVYTALYVNQGQELKRQSDYLVLPPTKLCAQLNGPTIFLGDGVPTYHDLLTQELGDLAHFAPAHLAFPRAAAIGQLAVQQFQAQKFIDPASAVPIYIRPSEAEINYQKRKRKPKEHRP